MTIRNSYDYYNNWLLLLLCCSLYAITDIEIIFVQAASVCTSSDVATPTDVVIVGAGISGLSACVELTKQQPNLNIVILEATNRIGGRVRKGTVGGYTVEKGANWLHSFGTDFRKLAITGSKLKTSQTRFLNNIVYDKDGNSIKFQFSKRLRALQRRGTLFTKAGPFYKMLQAAYQYWNDVNNIYDGSENIVDIMKQFGYNERDPLDAYIRWMLIDYEYEFPNVALVNEYTPSEGVLYRRDSETLIVDPRGFETVITKFVTDNSIPEPLLEVKVTDIIYDNNSGLDSTYKAIIQSVDTTDNSCVKYKAKRVIVTVPVSILRGKGYAINFLPSLNLSNLPFVTGQYNKLFYKFSKIFWDNYQFIGIMRDSTYQGVCNHWHNINFNNPGSKIIMCTLTNEGMEKVISMNLTTTDLLEPLRVVYGAKVVDSSLQDTFFSRWDLEPSSGYGAYASFQSGYTIDQNYQFWGGNGPAGFVKGEGYNTAGEWIVHLSGAASCFEYNEQVDGAYYAGQQSARYVLRSLGLSVAPITACEDW